MASALRVFGNGWHIQPRTTLFAISKASRLGLPRRNTTICCLSTKTSASSAARDRNRSTSKAKISLNRSHTQRRIVRFSAHCQPDRIYDRERAAGSISRTSIGAHHGASAPQVLGQPDSVEPDSYPGWHIAEPWRYDPDRTVAER